MTSVRWATLVSDAEGTIDYVRVRAFVSLLLAIAGGVALTLAMVGLTHPTQYVALGTSALILPITAGKITDILTAKSGATP